MKWKVSLYSFSIAIVLFGLSACQSDSAGKQEPLEIEIAHKEDKPAKEIDNNKGSTESVKASTKQDSERPRYLPVEFPIPKDADIRISNSGLDDGKKSVLLVFRTQNSMEEVTATYKDYFRNLVDDVETIDEKNIIIQGINQEQNWDWSMIGGELSDQEGVVEIQVTWAEL